MPSAAQWTAEKPAKTTTYSNGFYLNNKTSGSNQYLTWGTVDDYWVVFGTQSSLNTYYLDNFTIYYRSENKALSIYYSNGSSFIFPYNTSCYVTSSTSSYSLPSGANTFALYHKVTGGKLYDYTITNKATSTPHVDPNNAVVNVTKVWSDGDSGHSGDQVKIHLYKNGVDVGDTKVLSYPNLTASWTGLPEGHYTVEEEAVEGYQESVSGGLDLSTVQWVPASKMEEGETYAIVYKNSSGQYCALTAGLTTGGQLESKSLEWDSTSNAPKTVAEASQWTTAAAAAEDVSGKQNGFTLQNTANGTQYMYLLTSGFGTSSGNTSQYNIVHFNRLDGGLWIYDPSYYASGQTGWYFFDSENTLWHSSNSGKPDDATTYYLYKREPVGQVTYNYTVTNTPSLSQYDSVVNVNVTKKWGTGSEKQPVTVHLVDEEGNDLDDTYGTLTLDSGNNWSGSWEGLPAAIYTVKEDYIEGYSPTIKGERSTSKTIFVNDGTNTIKSGSTYLIGYDTTSYYYGTTSYLLQALKSGTYYTSWNSSAYTRKNTQVKIGDYTYTDYYTGVDEAYQWSAGEWAGSLSNYTAYQFENVKYSTVLSNSGTNLITMSSGVGLFYWYPGYLFKMLSTSSGSSNAYWVAGNSSGYATLSSASSSAVAIKLYKKITMTDYNYEIENDPVPEGTSLDLQSKEDYSKRIDALRDKANNPDTDIDDSNATDLTDLYRLYLDVGPMTLNQPVDLLIVVDESYSMEETTEYQREEKQRNLVLTDILNGGETAATANLDEGLIKEFLSLNDANRLAVIGFSGNPEDLTKDSRLKTTWTTNGWIDKSQVQFVASNADNFISATSGKEIGAGTNYSSALQLAETMFEARKNSTNKKVMVFLSDGVPTYYLDESGSTRGGTGYGSHENAALCKEPTMQSFDQFQENLAANNMNVTTYTVGFSTAINSLEDSANPSVLRYMARIGGGEFIGANDGDSLQAALEKYILGGGKFTQGEFRDQLSQYVEMYQDADFLLTMKGKEDSDSSKVILWKDNQATTDGANIVKSVKYDRDTHTVTATFFPNYALEVEKVYELSFNVKTTEGAYQLTAENLQAGKQQYELEDGTAQKGDAGTDYGSNTTSSGKDGFRSNVAAAFSYVQGNKKGSLTYDHPVVQTQACDLTIKKVSQDNQTITLQGAQFDLYRKVYEGEEASSVVTGGENGTVSMLPDGDYIKINRSSLVSGSDGTVKVTNLNPGNYYLIETKAPNGYMLPTEAFMFNLTRSTVNIADVGAGKESLIVGSSKEAVLTVKNDSGISLPETGGPGTKWYTLSGVLLMLSSMIMYKKLRKGGRIF
jgi:LPXTG-motif cell wall-anchored protein